MKRAISFVLAVLSLILLMPVFALVAVWILCDDGWPVFYQQRRVGRGMRDFTLYKFRTMANGADRKGLLTSHDDSRLTRSGRFLRQWKLDELPQLFNVLKGDMQLVGPRPEVRRYVAQFHEEYAELLREAPGITDPASLQFRNEEALLSGDDFEQTYVSLVLPRKLLLSIQYQRQRTLTSDAFVLLRTLVRIFDFRKTNPALPGLPARQD